MIDTITLKFEHYYLPDNYDQFLRNKLTDVEDIKKKNFDFFTTRGKLKNLYLTYNVYGLTIQGSLTKYLIGNNLGSLSKNDIQLGVKKLGDYLKINFFNAKVLRLDLACNAITNYPINFYKMDLMPVKYFKKMEYNESVYFKNNSRCILIYDKVSEMKKNKETVDEIFVNKNIIRMEYRFLNPRSLSYFLKIDRVSLNDVLVNFSKLVEEWRMKMKDIYSKRERNILAPEAYRSRKYLDSQLIMLGVNALGGLNSIFSMIDTAKSMKILKDYPNAASNLKSYYKKIMSTPDLFVKDDSGDELIKKIDIMAFILSEKVSPDSIHKYANMMEK